MVEDGGLDPARDDSCAGRQHVQSYLRTAAFVQSDFISTFKAAQLPALVLVFFEMYDIVSLVWELFFGLNLILCASLVYKSGYIPKLVCVLLIAISFAYFIQNCAQPSCRKTRIPLLWLAHFRLPKLYFLCSFYVVVVKPQQYLFI